MDKVMHGHIYIVLGMWYLKNDSIVYITRSLLHRKLLPIQQINKWSDNVIERCKATKFWMLKVCMNCIL